MTFWILVGVLVVVAVAWLAPVLLRDKPLRELDRRQQNVTIARERLDEIAAEHASGEMTSEVYEQVKSELEASLISDVDDQDKDVGQQMQGKGSGKLVLLVLVFLIPLGTIAMYQKLGSPHFLEYAGASAGRDTSIEHVAAGAGSIEELIDRLKARLEKNPADGEGWYLLARTHMSRQEFSEALEALKKSREVLGDHPAILTGMADATAMINSGDLTGKATEYLEKALELEPENTTGLWLGGMAAQQAGKFQLAIDRWARLKPLLGQEVASQQQVQELIDQAVSEARQKGIEVKVAGTEAPVETAGSDEPVAIKAWVSLDAAMQDRVSADDTIFVMAKAKEGPPMPLAARRLRVSDLPLEITLDDSMAMMPQMKLSGFDQVVVIARISKSGQPMASPGDISSEAVDVSLSGTVAVNLNLDRVLQ